MESRKKNKIIAFLTLCVVFFNVLSIHAQGHYRIIEMRGTVIGNGKVLKVGDVYQKGQMLKWSSGLDWMRVTRNDVILKVTPKGVRKDGGATKRSHISLQPQTKDLAHRGWSYNGTDSSSHYSLCSYYLTGKKDYLYFERKSTEENVSIEAMWEKNGIQKSAPIQCTIDMKYYIVTPALFDNLSRPDSIKFLIRESKDGYCNNEYSHGLKVFFYPK